MLSRKFDRKRARRDSLPSRSAPPARGSGATLDRALNLAQALSYSGRRREACDRLEESTARILGSLFGFVPSFRNQFFTVRAQVTIAAAVDAEDRDDLLALATDYVDELERIGMPGNLVFVPVLRAGIAWLRGDKREGIALLDSAIPDLDAGEFRCHAAEARRAKGLLVGGDEGKRLIDEADAALRAEGVKNPARFAATNAPGFG